MKEVVHGSFVAAFDAALPPVQEVFANAGGGTFHFPLLLPQTAAGYPQGGRHAAQQA